MGGPLILTLPEKIPLNTPINICESFSFLNFHLLPVNSSKEKTTKNTPIPFLSILSSRIRSSFVPKGRPIIPPARNIQIFLSLNLLQHDAITIRLMTIENISSIGTAVLGDKNTAKRGNESIENPKPDSPCNKAEAVIIIVPAIKRSGIYEFRFL